MSTTTMAAMKYATPDHKRIIRYIQQWPHAGATTDEVVAALKMSHQTVSARMSELKKGGYLVYAGKTRLTKLGKPAKAWIASVI